MSLSLSEGVVSSPSENDDVRLRVDEDVAGGFQLLVGGAKDLDEGDNGRVRYFLYCSSTGEKKTMKMEMSKLTKKVETASNCFAKFDLMFLSEMRSETLIGFDQLSIKILSSSWKSRHEDEKDEIELRLFGVDQNREGKELWNEMKIHIEMEEKTKVKKVVKKYLLVDLNRRAERRNLSDLIEEKTTTTTDEVTFQLVNRTKDVVVDRRTGRVNIERQTKQEVEEE